MGREKKSRNTGLPGVQVPFFGVGLFDGWTAFLCLRGYRGGRNRNGLFAAGRPLEG
jgi:hypothetical protein